MHHVVLAAVVVVVSALPQQALAQGQEGTDAAGYPVKPIRVIQPAPPGGASDVVLRAVTRVLSGTWGQSVVVDNRPGAHGMIANELAARARPDGYTLLYGTVGTIAINSGLYSKLPYRMPEDFAPVTQFVAQANVALVNAGLPIRSLGDLVQLAKAKPDALSFGSAGSGSATHLGPEMFRRRADIAMRHVPYKGAAAAALGVASGEVQVLFVSPVTAIPFIKGGRLRALAVTTEQRIPQMPEVPTIAESGYRGFSYVAWSGLLAPGKTPRALVAKLHREIASALKSHELSELISADGALAMPSESPQAFTSFIRAETAKWGKVIEQTNARVE